MNYQPGQRVHVSSRRHVGHHRTPAYAKGRTGTVARSQGAFLDPETRAYGSTGLPERQLYLVSLDSTGNDRVYADVFEHWLEAVE